MAIPPDDVKYCLRCGTQLARIWRMGAERPACPQCGYVHFFDPKVAVSVFVEDGGRLLLVQRGIEPRKGHWTVPGGFMDATETPETAAIRECMEETGLQVRLTGLLDVVSGREHSAGANFVVFYRAEVIGGMLAAADDAADVSWFTADTLPSIAFRATRTVVERWQAGYYAPR